MGLEPFGLGGRDGVPDLGAREAAPLVREPGCVIG